jgi:predicted phosphohydrolase
MGQFGMNKAMPARGKLWAGHDSRETAGWVVKVASSNIAIVPPSMEQVQAKDKIATAMGR